MILEREWGLSRVVTAWLGHGCSIFGGWFGEGDGICGGDLVLAVGVLFRGIVELLRNSIDVSE